MNLGYSGNPSNGSNGGNKVLNYGNNLMINPTQTTTI